MASHYSGLFSESSSSEWGVRMLSNADGLTQTHHLQMAARLCAEFGWDDPDEVRDVQVHAATEENRLKFNALVPVIVVEATMTVVCGGQTHRGVGEWCYWLRDQEWELFEFKEESGDSDGA